jgi:hypothetical protein
MTGLSPKVVPTSAGAYSAPVAPAMAAADAHVRELESLRAVNRQLEEQIKKLRQTVAVLDANLLHTDNVRVHLIEEYSCIASDFLETASEFHFLFLTL